MVSVQVTAHVVYRSGLYTSYKQLQRQNAVVVVVAAVVVVVALVVVVVAVVIVVVVWIKDRSEDIVRELCKMWSSPQPWF